MSPTTTEKPDGLAKKDATPDRITTSEQYQQAMKRWKDEIGAHVISPYAAFTGLAQGFALVATKIFINTEKGSGEIWDADSKLPWLKNNDCSISKVGLRKIAECGSMSTDTEDLSDYADPALKFFWRVKAYISWRGLDGTIITRSATKTWDCREGSPDIKGNFTVNQINEMRKHGLRHCESRAVNAAIREIGLKQTYTRDELKKPFIIVKAMFQPNMADPIQAKAVVEANLRGTSALYAQQREALPAAEPVTDLHPNVQDAEYATTPGTTPEDTGTAPAKASAPAAAVNPHEPPTKDAVKIAKIETSSGVTRGKPWTRYIIIDSNGVSVSTFDKQHFDDATTFRAADAWVEIHTEMQGDYVNVLEIVRAGAQPSLPDLGNI